jgi:LysR family hydrogen peroxide-inducible transcriptional activator
MQIQKLEEELGVKIFDRSKQPVLPTEGGSAILEHARKILAEKNALHEMIESKKGIINGELRIGIIPTLAPYLLPLFIHSFTEKYPQVQLQVTELTTEYIISRLRDGRIDAGILVTPLLENGIREEPLFYEEMVAYVSKENSVYKKTYVLKKDIDPGKLWLLEEGHCFRSQIMNLCELRKNTMQGGHFEYESGSLETLRRMVDLYDGITILPELATVGMLSGQQQHLRYFKQPAPVREVSLVTHRTFVKRRLVEALKQQILLAVPEKIKKNKKSFVVPI